jgi:hypothetical protein
MKLKFHRGSYYLIGESDRVVEVFRLEKVRPSLRVLVAQSNPLEVSASYSLKDGWTINPE